MTNSNSTNNELNVFVNSLSKEQIDQLAAISDGLQKLQNGSLEPEQIELLEENVFNSIELIEEASNLLKIDLYGDFSGAVDTIVTPGNLNSHIELMLKHGAPDNVICKEVEDFKFEDTQRKIVHQKMIRVIEQLTILSVDNIPLDDKELTLLIELSEYQDKTCSQVKLNAATGIPQGTIKDKLPRLEKIGLIDRPLGPRKGYMITSKGIQLAKKNQ